MATLSTVVSKVHQLAHGERCILDLLVMPVLPPASSSRQLLLSVVKGCPEPCLVFDHPIGYLARYWIEDFNKTLIKLLALPITGRVTWDSAQFCSPIQKAELMNQGTLKAPPLIRVELRTCRTTLKQEPEPQWRLIGLMLVQPQCIS